MRPWDLDTSTGHMRDAMDKLQLAWQETSEVWQDEVSQNFCETHLEPIGDTLKLTLDAVGRMQRILDKMKRDCES